MEEWMMVAGGTRRKCHACLHINESSYSVMERKIKSISTISVRNEFGEAWRNIPFNVFYVIRDNLAPHQLVVSRQSILIIFPFAPTMPVYFLCPIPFVCCATLVEQPTETISFPSSHSGGRRTKAVGIWNINDGEISVSLKRCHFSSHLMCVRAVSAQVNSNRFGHIYHRAAVLNH